MLPGAGRGITEAVNRLMDSGTPEEVREFVATGQHKIRAVDDRVALFAMLNKGRPGAGDRGRGREGRRRPRGPHCVGLESHARRPGKSHCTR